MPETVVKVLFGSHLYGTNTPQSDIDFKGVHIPDAKEILLQRVPETISIAGREKAEGEKNQAGDVDQGSYSLQRYFSLLAEGQTVAIDMLFAPNDKLLDSSPLWNCIQRNRERFLSKKSAAFLGYCRQQANKYGIKGSRVAAAKAASEAFEGMCGFSGPVTKVSYWNNALEELCKEHPDHLSIETVLPREHGKGVETYFVCCNRKVPFTASLKLATEICTRVYESYGDRARKAQDNEGVDWKALSHAVRVGYEAIELLNTHRITLPLPNAEHILEIKQGKVPYEDVAGEIEQLLVDVEAAAVASTLPDEADLAFMDHLVLATYGHAVGHATVGDDRGGV